MTRPLFLVPLIAAVVGGAYFFANYEFRTERGSDGAISWRIASRHGAGQPAPETLRPTFRIATYQLGRLDDAKLANPRAGEVLMHLLPQFDLVALQGVRGRDRGVLIRLVEQLGAATGRSYDFATCPTQQRDALEHYAAFVFDTARIDCDRTTVHFVEDHRGRFRTKPLVGAFRARGPNPAQAFTFVLINAETDAEHADVELDALAEAYRAVRRQFANEDDVILLGDLAADDRHLGGVGRLLGVGPLVSGVPSTVRGTQLLDNILLDRRATCEFTGRVEVVDIIRQFELTAPGASEVSEHLPVWAEFSVYEGGHAGSLTTANQ
jgi:deoxyribonuclease-1-like protein